jgi:plastocyanin
MKGHYMRIALGVGLFIAAAVGIAAVAQSRPTATEVKIDNFTFTPADLNVPVGATVVWTNHDDIPHTVVSTDKAFKSKVLDSDEKYSFTFGTAGTFTYFCSIHPKMTAKVIVQ